jgi:phosphopantetheinyl transferase
MVTLTTAPSQSGIAKSLIAKWATSDDYAQAKTRQSKTRQHDYLLARATLRALLTHITGTGDWRICPDARGKPQISSIAGIAGPHISLSHTQGLVACAVSETNPVGVDVEYWRARDFMALADYAFGPREREEVAHDGISAFYRIWTLREALSKASGIGLMATLDGNDCVADFPGSSYWATKDWQLFYVSPQANYSFAMATKDESIWSKASLTWVDAMSMV